MKGRVRARVSTEQLLAYVEGELGADEAAAVERSGIECGDNRRRLDQLRTLRHALRAPVPELEERDLARAVRAIAQEPAAAAREDWAWMRMLRFALPVAALLAMLGVGSAWQRAEPVNELPAEGTVRSKAGETSGANRWAGVRVYRAPEGGTPERLGERLGTRDGLLFSYTNLGREPFAHLMLFAVDAQQSVHWFYPATSDTATNTGLEGESISIVEGKAEVPLPELIHADVAPGPLSIYAAFTRAPLHVQQVEAWLRSHPKGGTGFAPPGSAVSRLEVQVERDPRAGAGVRSATGSVRGGGQ